MNLASQNKLRNYTGISSGKTRLKFKRVDERKVDVDCGVFFFLAYRLQSLLCLRKSLPSPSLRDKIIALEHRVCCDYPMLDTQSSSKTQSKIPLA